MAANPIKLKGALNRDVLFYLAACGAGLAALSISPVLLMPALVYVHGRKVGISEKTTRNTLYGLKKKGFIHIESSKGAIEVVITPKGRKHISKYSPLYMKPLSGRKWDKKWRIVMFDIGVSDRAKRNTLRKFLKRLGFARFQQSAWITPYECRKEIKELVVFTGLKPAEVRLIVAEHIGEDKEFRKAFNL